MDEMDLVCFRFLKGLVGALVDSLADSSRKNLSSVFSAFGSDSDRLICSSSDGLESSDELLLYESPTVNTSSSLIGRVMISLGTLLVS